MVKYVFVDTGKIYLWFFSLIPLLYLCDLGCWDTRIAYEGEHVDIEESYWDSIWKGWKFVSLAQVAKDDESAERATGATFGYRAKLLGLIPVDTLWSYRSF
jgi:hypothetical protein